MQVSEHKCYDTKKRPVRRTCSWVLRPADLRGETFAGRDRSSG